MRRHFERALLWAALAFALDQVTKWLILDVVMVPPRLIEIAPFLNLRLGFNYGVSFGLFRDTLEAWPELLAAFKLIVAIGLLFWAARCDDGRERVGLGLIAGGALGNALDRWRQGAVTDFIDLHYQGWHWPTFNGADIAISAGVGLMLLAALPSAQPAPKPRT
ncbi:signal peptidase II [Bosea sp. 2KB_26]|uniref:signal peptidase II n=1 Tax=Bosea sp. 2KB_26 TaxID=3237475 RepID=UPI000DE1D907